jgi:hypothetical protein
MSKKAGMVAVVMIVSEAKKVEMAAAAVCSYKEFCSSPAQRTERGAHLPRLRTAVQLPLLSFLQFPVAG